MWTREDEPSNMVINDPKGELLVKFYVRGTVRGYQIVQFNLINIAKTDVYNPLGLAAESAREGDFTKVAEYVDNIASVFFPVDGSQDPVWPNAANNAFKRTAYGMVDYFMEEERSVRLQAAREGWDEKKLEMTVDALWGKVTLYNCYQLFVVLAAKKLKNPIVEFKNREKNGDFNPLTDEEQMTLDRGGKLRASRQPMTDEEFQIAKQEALDRGKLWQGKAEDDLLTLFFNASAELPSNSIRRLVGNADNSLRSMAGAEKMLASYDGLSSENHKEGYRAVLPGKLCSRRTE